MNQTLLNRSRLDKFTLLMDLPFVMKGQVDNTLQLMYKPDVIQFTVFGSPVPKIEIPSIKLPFGGQHMHVTSGGRSDYGPLTLRFLLDNSYQGYWILWKWLNLFNDYQNSDSDINHVTSLPQDPKIVMNNPFSNYVTTFELNALDEYNNKIINFKYNGCFITSLSEISFSHQDESLITCSASFAYNQLHVNLITDQNKII
jgi:hypothetical protein